jgi:hypothetical protein
VFSEPKKSNTFGPKIFFFSRCSAFPQPPASRLEKGEELLNFMQISQRHGLSIDQMAEVEH